MGGPGGAGTDPLHEQQASITQSARRYDLAALVAALRSLGYSDENIELRSNHTTRHQASVIEQVEFLSEPRPRALITVNLSLLSPQSPLPTYFQRILDQQADSSLAAFLNFFSHRLLRADVIGMFPERNPELFTDFGRTKRQLLSLLGLRSLSTAHWLFQGVFPELEVAVRRTVLQRPVRTHGMVLGEWAIGDGTVCGGLATAPVSALGITLFCDEVTDSSGEPWARSADRRLHEQLFPHLASQGLFMEVALVFRDQSTFMVLAPQQYLGYEPLHPGGGPGSADPSVRTSRTVILFSGEVPASPSTGFRSS